MTPIPDKFDIALYAQKYFYETATAVEVGVFEGAFSAHNLKSWRGNYMMVDTWAFRPEDDERGLSDKNSKSETDWTEIIKKASANTEFARNRTVMFKGYSTDACQTLLSESVDWIYIDAGHDYQNMKADLNAWWSILRPGGLFSGDDYGLSEDDPSLSPLTANRWERKLGGVAKDYKWGTAKALNEFCREHNLTLQITWLNDQHNPSWYIIKPFNFGNEL